MSDNNPRAKSDIMPREWDVWEWAEVTKGDDVEPQFVRTKSRVQITQGMVNSAIDAARIND